MNQGGDTFGSGSPFMGPGRLRNEMRELAASLDASKFKALSAGLGLGDLRPVSDRPKRPQVMGPTSSESVPPMGSGATGITPPSIVPTGTTRRNRRSQRRQRSHPTPSERGTSPPMKPASRLRVGLEKRLLAWSLDLAIVTLSLAVVLLCGGYYATGGLRAAGIIAFFKGEWLGGVSPWIILAGAYGVFLCYGLVFRLLVGATFGESLLGVGRHGRLMTRRIPKS